jgi:nucleoside-diphosphate-sugar epimerase
LKIFVTGNMGYVGPRVVWHLRRAFPDSTLVGADAGWFASLLTNAQVLPESVLDAQYFCDVREIPAEALNGVDAVVHLAGVSNDPIGTRFESVTADINVGATVKLARLARRAGARRFVFASSCSVYGFAEEGARTEQSPLNPLTAYARSKVEAETELARLASPDFGVTALRFATACGMSERLRLDLVVNQFVASAIATGRIDILSDGTPWRPLIHVDDMSRAIEWAIGRDLEVGACLVVNTGHNDSNYTVLQIAEAVADVLPCSIHVNPNAQPDKRSYRVDFSLFERLASEFQPRVSLRSAIEGLRDGLQAMAYRDPDVQQSPLIRLRTLSRLQAEGLLSDELRWLSRVSPAAVS